MKTKAICSFFVLFAIVAGIGATTPAAFAQAEVTIEPTEGSGVGPGCEDTNECWTPNTITVDVGVKVIFSNTDSDKHTFTSGTIFDDEVGIVFNSGLVFPGEEEYWVTDTVGEFPYFCLIHPWMDGLIIVQEAGAVEETVEEETMMEETVEEETMMEETVEEETMMEETEVIDETEGGGCLIATATFGSELAPQVQQLRELRDNTILSTESGTAFMAGFNQLYYSFSPTIADLEREYPVFKEVVKLSITP
ncbi:MAG: CFI-box-CTERM domain-containing protein, partial [Nitrosopumilus sp.]